jgi:hypothetical protein
MRSFALKLIHPIITITYLLLVFQFFFQIFIPINDRGIHWYLMIVDFVENKVLLLDSLPCPERQSHRRREVLKLVCDLVLITYRMFFSVQFINILIYCRVYFLRKCLLTNLSMESAHSLQQHQFQAFV